MRILLLNWRDVTHPAAGGSERFVHEIARRWVGLGHEVTIFCSSFRGASSDEERVGARVIRRGTRRSVFRMATDFMRHTGGQWDAVIESINTRPFFAHRTLRSTPTAAVIHQLARDVWFHETALPIALAGRYLLEPLWLRRYVDVPVVAVSDSTGRDLQVIGIRNISIAPPGSPAPPDRPGPPKEAVPTLLFVGRLNPSKRPGAAVATWRIVRQSMPEAKLWVVGDGPLRRALEREAGGGLTVWGKVDEGAKWDLLARAHLLLVPSVREGWGIGVMEAGTAGTPSIGYRVPGLVDSIRHGRTGWLCDPSPESMAAVALRALNDPCLSSVGARAGEWARSFSWDETADIVLSRIDRWVAAP